jgi:RND family efflux transporter MFP subunit
MKTLPFWASLTLMAAWLGLSGCSRPASSPEAVTPAPWVRTTTIESAASAPLVLSGVVRARHETPMAFQIGGRVLSRHVEAGQTVRAGQLLFALDPRDVATSEQAAAAQLAAAEAAMVTAQRELERQKQLVAQGFVSPQTLDRLELSLRNTVSQLDAARAVATQSRHARGYTELRAPRDGVIADVFVAAGEQVTDGTLLLALAEETADAA